LLAERDGLMFIPLDDRSTRRRLLEHLRNHHYLAIEHKDGVVAQALNPISVRHDRAALSTLVRQWITRGDPPPTGRDQPGS
ncbi:MAG: hypothetical protein JO186_08940, partial [Actinobacteria bacterium]|nr:hypothetical protein [Actinomycetota bacterium]